MEMYSSVSRCQTIWSELFFVSFLRRIRIQTFMFQSWEKMISWTGNVPHRKPNGEYFQKHRKYSPTLWSTKNTLIHVHLRHVVSFNDTYTLFWKMTQTDSHAQKPLGHFHTFCSWAGLQWNSLNHPAAKLTIKHTCEETGIATGASEGSITLAEDFKRCKNELCCTQSEVCPALVWVVPWNWVSTQSRMSCKVQLLHMHTVRKSNK